MNPSTPQRKSHAAAEPRWTSVLGVTLFMITLWLPLGVSLLGRDATISTSEQRFLADVPALGSDYASWVRFPSQLETYYNDHLGFRVMLIRAQALLDIELFGVSPSDKLIIGKGGWLFFGDRDAIAHYRGVAPLSDAELETWRLVLEERRDWLRGQGAAFVVVLVPDKPLMYPEQMPDALPRVSEVYPLGQLAQFLAEHSDLDVLDLRPPLQRARNHERTYHRTDAHWNERGAYAAYLALHERLQSILPMLEGIEPAAVERGRHEEPGMGLASLVGLESFYGEEVLTATPVAPRSSVKPPHRDHYAERVRTLLPIAHGVDDPALPRAVMFRDSYANALIPYVSEDFQRILYVWDRDVDPRVVRIERPDVVIQQIVGRFLGRRPKRIVELSGRGR